MTNTTTPAKPDLIPTDPAKYGPEGGLRYKRLVLDSDLADGAARTIHDAPDQGLLDIIRAWMEDAEDGEAITLSIISLSNAEADAIPEI